MSDPVSFSAGDLASQFNSARLTSEVENNILLGQKSESVSGLQDRGPTANPANPKDEKRHKSRAKNTSEFLHILETLQAGIDRLAEAVEQMEADFRQRDGEEWREKLALKILGENDIPQRHDGESMEDYRERIEKLLINEMLNDDGSIKEEYKNDPELSDYAQWAQKQYHLDSARAAVSELENPHTTPERRDEILEGLDQRGDLEELTFADRESTPQSTTQELIKNTTDNVEDSNLTTDQSDGSNVFLKL
ncbi:MAG: hypothetical protein AB2805_07430 [Candidatus Thiodiazotropha sp.]